MVQLRDGFQLMVGYSQTPHGRGLLAGTPALPWGSCCGGASSEIKTWKICPGVFHH